ncbi:MAG: response regulator transcription factor [Balneolaceae bacterium]|nr:response regulator transcription factor [Balneolaceae bacterium]
MDAPSIVLAEPNELLRKVLDDKLSMHGFNILPVVNGIELEEILDEKTVDLIIAEEFLPYKNGLEIIELANLKNIPVIIISDADLEEKIIEAFELGASDFIDKPFSPNEVLARAKNILKTKSRVNV